MVPAVLNGLFSGFAFWVYLGHGNAFALWACGVCAGLCVASALFAWVFG